MIYKFFNISIVLFGIIFSVHAQSGIQASDQLTLNQADSLFESKKYTEALKLYNSLFEAKKSSPAMLLRMAFIHEGLSKDVEALYFLHQYYALTADRRVLTKITELAETNDLRGYEYSDLDYILNLIDRYRMSILGALAALIVLSIVLIWRQSKQEQSAAPALVLQIICLAMLFTLTNHLLEKEQGIISSRNTILMTGPSAGATPIRALEKGHKVTVIESDEVWTKIRWEDQVGFVRNNRILPI